MFRKKIKVKYHANITPLEQTNWGDWIDLRCAKQTIIPAGTSRVVPLGVSMKLPRRYEANVLARSSLRKNFSVIQTNAMGVIDNTYCGDGDEWFVELHNISEQSIAIAFNARICQFRIVKKMPKVKFKKVSSLGYPNRGGHGSSGIH